MSKTPKYKLQKPAEHVAFIKKLSCANCCQSSSEIYSFDNRYDLSLPLCSKCSKGAEIFADEKSARTLARQLYLFSDDFMSCINIIKINRHKVFG